MQVLSSAAGVREDESLSVRVTRVGTLSRKAGIGRERERERERQRESESERARRTYGAALHEDTYVSSFDVPSWAALKGG